jgi:hypothetical protein
LLASEAAFPTAGNRKNLHKLLFKKEKWRGYMSARLSKPIGVAAVEQATARAVRR